MKLKKIMAITFIFLVVILSVLNYFFKPLKCKVNAHITSNEYTLSAMIFYDLKYGEGIISIDGKIDKNNKNIESVRRKIFLDYYSNGNKLYLKKYKIITSDNNNTKNIIEYNKLLPILEPDFSIELIPEGSNYIMKTRSLFPSFYCYE